MKNIYYYLSPDFIIEYYLSKSIEDIESSYKFNGKLIDIGCGSKPFKKLFKNINSYKGIDFKDYSVNRHFSSDTPDYYFNKDYYKTLKLPFKNNSFNTTVCFQVLEHHVSPAKLVAELFRITGKGGFILISFPFIWGLHEEPHDYCRLTNYGFNKLIEEHDVEFICYKKLGSLFSTISILVNGALVNLSNKNRLLYITCIIFYPFILFFSYLSIFQYS